MPRPRSKANAGLPARWSLKHGAYYYQVPAADRAAWDGRTWFRLGRNLPEAHRVFSERLTARLQVTRTVGDLLDRYAREVVPTKAPATRASNGYAIKQLRQAFGPLKLSDVTPQLVYQYVDRRTKKVAAHREIEVLQHAFGKAVRWGSLNKHPFKGEIRFEGTEAEKPRERYVEDWEIVSALALPIVRKRGSVLAIQAYIRFKLLTGLRRGDLLRLRVSDCHDDGIAVQVHKTGKPIIYTWSDLLRRAVADAKAARPVDISPWLFCNRRGECYVDESQGTAAGFKSMWQRFMARVLKETNVKEHFTEHDLRAKVGSDAESLERARALLAHADARTTQRVYRRKPERVRPLR